jgi:hypothetical protein
MAATERLIHSFWAVESAFAKNDSYLYPNLMSANLARKMPPTVLYTTEFCHFRTMTEQARNLFRLNGRLLDYGCLKGSFYGHYNDYRLQRTDEWFNAIAKVAKKYL